MSTMQIVPAPSPGLERAWEGRPSTRSAAALHQHADGRGGALERLCDPKAKGQRALHGRRRRHRLCPCAGRQARLACRRRIGRAPATSMRAPIRIEIVNPGHEFGAGLSRKPRSVSWCICARRFFPVIRFSRHACSVIPMWRLRARVGPGELFPWGTLGLSGVGLWPQTRKSKLKVSFAEVCAHSVTILPPTSMYRWRL